jgi:Ca-activated chloride channel family protein
MRYALALCCALWPAQLPACDLALALAVDVSGSVDPQEYRIQMQGLADALRDGVVSEALVRAEAAVMLVQWTGTSRQEVTLPWTRITSFEDAEALAQQVETAPRAWRNFSTAIGDALEFILMQWPDAPACERQIIDVSGDGVSNEGREPRSLHPQLSALGITVNALAIEESEEDLTGYFYENLIHGEGAFVITANRFEDYPDAIRQKLLREVTAQVSSLGHPSPDEG